MANTPFNAWGEIYYIDPADGLEKRLLFDLSFPEFPGDEAIEQTIYDNAVITVCESKFAGMAITDCESLIKKDTISWGEELNI